MTRSKLLLGVLGTALLSACGPTRVAVNAELSSDDPAQAATARALGDLEIRMFPFNRDVVFDSLTRGGDDPRATHSGLRAQCPELGRGCAAGVA